jgi:hypothetical protein
VCRDFSYLLVLSPFVKRASISSANGTAASCGGGELRLRSPPNRKRCFPGLLRYSPRKTSLVGGHLGKVDSGPVLGQARQIFISANTHIRLDPSPCGTRGPVVSAICQLLVSYPPASKSAMPLKFD